MTIENILKSIVNLILGIVAALLSLRIIFRLLDANTNNEFVNWIYESSGEIISPFRGIFTNPNLDGYVIDFTAIFALLVYGLLGMLAFYLINLLTVAGTGTRKRK